MSSQERDVVHFFKVVLERNLLDDGVLKLPKSFVSKYWKAITSRSIVLTLPNRTNLEVYWSRDEQSNVFFSNGWKEFAQHLSLKPAQFLVFRYELKKFDNNKFDVIVLSSSGLEIKYPSCCSNKKKGDDHHVNDIGEGQKGQKNYGACSVEIGNGKRQRCPSPPQPRPVVLSDDDETSNFKRMKKTVVKEEPESHSVDAEENNMNGKKMKASNNDDSEVLDPKIMKQFHEKVKKNFQSLKPYFVCTIGKTYSDRDILVIPNDFARPVLENREGNAKLFVRENRYWGVKIRLLTNRQLTMISGWRKFSFAYGLKLGDVCVFELVDPIHISFRVHIHRFGEDDLITPPSAPEYSSEQEGACYSPPSSPPHVKKHKIEKANCGFMPKNDFTIHINKATCQYRYAVIPIEYIRFYHVKSGTIATLQVDGKREIREWKVKVLYYPQNGYARFSQGWPNFVKEFRLKFGDSCRCELIDSVNLKFRVSIIKGTH